MSARKRTKRTRQLFVVTNRLPVSRIGGSSPTRWKQSSGGLVTALRPTLEQHPGEWIGWDGSTGRTVRPFDVEGLKIRPVRLASAEVDHYYHGFSNRTLWPLYHDAIRTPQFRREWWLPYVEVNLRFARMTARTARKGDLVWVHDYHLQLAPAMIRELRPDLRIGFFLHIPFPPEELFTWLPWRKEILVGLLGADVIGFQTPSSATNFSRVARHHTDAVGSDSTLAWQGRKIAVRAFPISIDAPGLESLADSPKVLAHAGRIKESVGHKRKILLGVDRIDYTKGIEHRLLAFEHLLRTGAETVDSCVLMQIAVPSREAVADYNETRIRIEQIVGRINGEFSRPERVPVHYFRRSLAMQDLAAYYKAADVMVVSPLRDGMNLVAKEFVATRTDSSGVLVLSEFAGAAKELGRALLVNPRDTEGFALTLRRALHLPRPDAARRMRLLRAAVRKHDVFQWAGEFMDALSGDAGVK